MKGAILKRKKELVVEREEKDREEYLKLSRAVGRRKTKCAEEMIKKIIDYAFDPFNSSKTDIVNFFAKNASMHGGGGHITLIESIQHYENRNGCYKSLLPVYDGLWPDKEYCIPVSKIKIKKLRVFFKEIERVCKFKCWVSYGFVHYTWTNLNTTTDSALFMYFETN